MPPKRIESLRFPVFGIAWSPSMLVYCGGGGSSKSGIGNSIVIANHSNHSNTDEHAVGTKSSVIIDTGDEICVGIGIRHDAESPPPHILAAIGDEVRLYDSVSGSLLGSIMCHKDFKGVNCVAFSVDGSRVIAGCEGGSVLLFSLKWNTEKTKVDFEMVAECAGHAKAVCAVSFPPVEGAFQCLSSAKDGTARVWDERSGAEIGRLACSIAEPGKPPAKKNAQVLVRGCCYDAQGLIYTVASGRKGSAYLAKWQAQPHPQQPQALHYVQIERKCVSKVPISAMNMSGDRSTLAFGNVSGSIILLRADTLQVIKTFEEVHDLPVTCIAAKPLHSLAGEEADAISASADSKLVFFSTKREPRSLWIDFWCFLLLVFFAFSFKFSHDQCRTELLAVDMDDLRQCVVASLMAPISQPGILIIPH
mmetsp:Transcript_2394/g.3550  ORF Transcript_2394/g.3550 Transcript_2394/m.3550 type:complete len:420 (+) Transcript_2394:109-1368(+)